MNIKGNCKYTKLVFHKGEKRMKTKKLLLVAATVFGMLIFSGCTSYQERMTEDVRSQMESGERYDKRETNQVEQQALKGKEYDRKETDSLN